MEGDFRMEQAAVTSLFTLLGGIILFILSQYFLKFHFEPMSDLRKIIGQISKELVLMRICIPIQ